MTPTLNQQQQYSHEYYLKNKEKILSLDKEHYERNREKIRATEKRYRENNREKELLRKKIYRDSHKEKIALYEKGYKRNRVVRPYKIKPEDYYAMLSNQGGKCAICGETPEKDLYIDHDHSTGRVRGLLCVRCNTGIGWFRDNPVYLHNAEKYLFGVS